MLLDPMGARTIVSRSALLRGRDVSSALGKVRHAGVFGFFRTRHGRHALAVDTLGAKGATR